MFVHSAIGTVVLAFVVAFALAVAYIVVETYCCIVSQVGSFYFVLIAVVCCYLRHTSVFPPSLYAYSISDSKRYIYHINANKRTNKKGHLSVSLNQNILPIFISNFACFLVSVLSDIPISSATIENGFCSL